MEAGRIINLRNNLSSSLILNVFRTLDKKDRRRTFQVLLIQITLAFFDLVGVGIIGALGALTVSGTSSKGPGDRVKVLLNLLGIENSTIQIQAFVLGILAAATFILKTILSMFLLKKTNLYLARRGAKLSSELIEKVFQFPLLKLREKTLMDWQYQLTVAVDIVSMGIITTTILMIADVALLLVLGVGLFYVEPLIAFTTLLLFSLSALAVYRRQHSESLRLGSQIAEVNILTGETLHLVYDSYRDLFIRSALPSYSNKMRFLRFRVAELNALRAYMPYVGKFTLEITMILGFLFISASQFALNEAGRAVANIAIFFVASARISPAVLRIQQGFLMIKGNRGQAENALLLIEEVKKVPNLENNEEVSSPQVGENELISLKFASVGFKYPKNEEFKLHNLSFEIDNGASIAIIGSSGSGKSTIVDLMLGIFQPTSGEVLLNDLKPNQLIRKFPGLIAFVPQRIVVANKTIRDNLAIGLDSKVFEEEIFWESLKKAQLQEFVMSLPNGLDTKLGPGGIDLSGGQIQRLGLARALLTRPKLLILDEATSALDGKTEFLITEALEELKNSVTLVVIAHRLSTISRFERILYFKEGKLVGQGSFQELVEKYPDIAEQAQLMKI